MPYQRVVVINGKSFKCWTVDRWWMKGLLPLSLLGVKVESLEYKLLINRGWKTTVKFLFPSQYIVSLKLRLSARAAFLSQFYVEGRLQSKTSCWIGGSRTENNEQKVLCEQTWGWLLSSLDGTLEGRLRKNLWACEHVRMSTLGSRTQNNCIMCTLGAYCDFWADLRKPLRADF